LTKPTAVVLILCALNAWYMMAAAIYAQVFGRPILPVGKPWIDLSPEPVGTLAKETA
jgi:succinate-acetate transporter protein